MGLWKSYVDDTIFYLKEEFIEHILSKLSGYHDNIKFIYGIENDGDQSFLGVIVMRGDCGVGAAICRGIASGGMHLRWRSFSCGVVQCRGLWLCLGRFSGSVGENLILGGGLGTGL